jgi:GNAT superfamily N-acetyltransferase
MPGLEVQPFSEEHLDAAGDLLAERHRRHREAEPLLTEPADYRAEVEALWRGDQASGVVGLRDGRITGYVLGISKDEGPWGPNVWVEPAGHAVEQAEDLRDLYAAAAVDWVEQGRTRHYALAPASDAPLLEAWYRLSFGQQQALGIREIPDAAMPENVRPAEERDVEELDGRIVGGFELAPTTLSPMHVSLAGVEGAVLLAWAVTRPDVRGSGAGVALTDACFAWAREHGYEVMVTDWRVTNLLASRFWPRRGFRETFLRLYRSIP